MTAPGSTVKRPGHPPPVVPPEPAVKTLLAAVALVLDWDDRREEPLWPRT
ncbi:hypothetical protein Q0F99_15125 [Rathayibacter oskolensis]|nr:hypothetical protein [Rathayibacter oskolensis]WKK71001.1 hypothetical protein Q0F99_15125 [Rathayibacter oskolensis]